MTWVKPGLLTLNSTLILSGLNDNGFSIINRFSFVTYTKQQRKQYRQSLLPFIPDGQRFKFKLARRPSRLSAEQIEENFNRRILQNLSPVSKATYKPLAVGSLAGGTVKAYNSHGGWSTLGKIRELEKEERGNTFPELKFPNDTPAIWVCLSRRKALRYMVDADQWDRLNGTNPLTSEDLALLDEVAEVTLRGSDLVVATDGDDGYLILRVEGN